jgi:hypothetical protein
MPTASAQAAIISVLEMIRPFDYLGVARLMIGARSPIEPVTRRAPQQRRLMLVLALAIFPFSDRMVYKKVYKMGFTK